MSRCASKPRQRMSMNSAHEAPRIYYAASKVLTTQRDKTFCKRAPVRCGPFEEKHGSQRANLISRQHALCRVAQSQLPIPMASAGCAPSLSLSLQTEVGPRRKSTRSQIVAPRDFGMSAYGTRAQGTKRRSKMYAVLSTTVPH